jgi:predicted metal-dependent hydrolase
MHRVCAAKKVAADAYPRAMPRRAVSTRAPEPEAPVQGELALGGADVEVRRSTRRKRTVSAYREGDRTIVLVPARMSKREEREVVAELVARLDARDARARPSDDVLFARARVLSAEWLDGRAEPLSVRWVSNQRQQWGSCTPMSGSIRLSDRMKGMPDYVIDAVLMHELVHLLEPSHSPRFYALLEPYPHTVRASAYLDGYSFGSSSVGSVDGPDSCDAPAVLSGTEGMSSSPDRSSD